jgi:hypothetical protein
MTEWNVANCANPRESGKLPKMPKLLIAKIEERLPSASVAEFAICQWLHNFGNYQFWQFWQFFCLISAPWQPPRMASFRLHAWTAGAVTMRASAMQAVVESSAATLQTQAQP